MEVDEDASQRKGEEVWAQQAAGVNDCAPGLADTAGCGEAAWRKASEDIEKHIFR